MAEERTAAGLPRRHAFDRPFWLNEVRAAKAAAWASLGPAEAEAARLAQTEWLERKRERQKERARAKRMRLRRIVDLAHDGRSGEEIASAIGISVSRLKKIASDHAIAISWRPTAFRRRAVVIDRSQEGALRRLGQDAGATAADALTEVVAMVLEQDAHVARQLLRVSRRGP
jgi:hypothetical protein